MQKALSSDLKTAAAPAPKKYLPHHVRFSQKISTLPAVTETFENIPSTAFPEIRRKIRLNRRTRNFREISASTVFTEIRRKIRLNRFYRNSQKNPPQPP